MAATGKRKRLLAVITAGALVLATAVWLTKDDEPKAPPQVAPAEELVVLERREADASEPETSAREEAGKARRARSKRSNAGAGDVERIGGSVTDRRGAPLEGVQVALRAKRGHLSASLGFSATSRTGAFAFDLSGWSNEFALRRTLRRVLDRDEDSSLSPIAALEPYGSVRIQMTASAEGFAPATIEATLAELRERPQDFRFQLDDGTELTGYVIRNSPSANWRVAGAQVSLLERNGAVVASTTANASGRFLLRAQPGRYELFARHEVYGTALLTGFDLTQGEPGLPHSIELRHGREIRGSVHYADGTPVADLALEAVHTLLSRRESPELGLAEQVELESPEGLARAFAVTDANGHFSFPSLREGRFELRTPGTSEVVLRGPTVVATDLPDAAFTYRGQRLRVEVSDVDGSVPLDAQLECWRIERRFEPAPEHEVSSRSDGRGVFYVEALPGERLYVRTFAAGSPFAWTIVDVDGSEGERRLSLRLGDVPLDPSDGAPSLNYVLGVRLALEVLDESGAKLDGWRGVATSEQGDVPAGWTGCMPGSDGSLPPLPPGRFRVGLLPTRRDAFHCFTSVGAEIEAEIGSSRAVTLRVPLGGRLRLRMPTEASDVDAWRDTNLWEDLADNGWSVEALALEGEREPVALLLSGQERPDYAGFSALPGWEVDASPPLLPGRYRLRFTRASSSARVVEVTVRAGEITTAAP